MSEVVYLSPSRLATYADCPRKFDHDYDKGVTTPDQTRLYLNQGRAYHETIEKVCNATERDDDPQTIHDRAVDAFAEVWDDHLEPDEYESRAHQAYQRTENREAIAAFFDPEDGDGIDHARNSIATEIWLESEHDDVGLHGYADNVVRTDDGLHVIDYKRHVRGVITSRTAKYLEEHHTGDSHDPKRVKNAFQTAAYVEGVKQSDLYEDGMTVRFSFYGLVHNTTHESGPDGYEISVSARRRETTDVYEEHYDTIWALIRDAHEGIRTERYEPTDFELINEEACPDCDYREMCPEYLSEAVRR